MALLTASGCQTSPHPEPPRVVTAATPLFSPSVSPRLVPAPELNEELAFSRPSIRRGEPLYQPRPRREVPRSSEELPEQVERAETSRPPSQSPPPRVAETPDYPTAPSSPDNPPPKAGAPAAPSSWEKKRPGQGDEEAVFFEFSDEIRAKAIYAPIIAFDNLEPVRAMYAKKEVTVRFDVSPNGRFKVMLLEGTGDPELDKIALETLRQWRWRPKTVGRRPVGSIEILTLHARVL